MHEGNFTAQIVDAIVEALETEPNAKPEKIEVKVGEMLHLVPESVQTHYEMLTKGTRLEGVLLQLEEVPVLVECLACQQKGSVEDHHLLVCKACGSMNVKILQGNEVFIEPLEVEDKN